MSSNSELWAEAYRRNILPPEKKALYEEAMRRGLVQGPQRSLGQRFLDNLSEGFNRSGAGQVNRDANPNGNGGIGDARDIWQAPRLREGGLIDRGLDAVLGQNRGYLRGTSALTPAEQRERQRRARYDALARGDPIRNPAEFAAFLAGQIAGGGASPENWVAPGRSAVTRAAGNAAVAGGTDVVLQGNDVMSGVQDEYSALQTAGAAVLGGGLSIAVDAVRPVSRWVKSAFTDPVAPKTPEIALDVPGAKAARETTVAAPESSATVGAEVPAPKPAAPPEPEFGIVQPVNRKSPWKDALSRVREGELPQMVGDFMGRAYTAIVSDQHPLARAVADMRSQTEALTGKPEDLLPSADPRKLARGRIDWAAIGHQDLLHGVHAYKGVEPTTPALADVVSAVAVRAKRSEVKPEAALQRFNEYMVARRSLAEWDRHARGEIEQAPVARSREQAEAFIKHVEAESPEFRELSDGVNDYAGGLLKKALDGGLIDKATYDASMGNRDFYVPMRRVMDEGAASSGKVTAGNKGAEVKAFRGSERDVVDPLSVLIQRTYRLNQRIRQNELNLSLVRMGERLEAAQVAAGLEGGNGWLRKVDTPMRKTTVGVDELKMQSRVPDAVDDMFDADGVEVWRPGDVNDAGQAILYTWRDGKREAWEVIDQEWGKDVFEAISGMSKGMEDTFLNTLAAPTAMLAQTITRDPAFLSSNFIRDQLSAWVLTDVGFTPGESILGIADELKQTDITRVYGLSGGISGGASTAMLGDALHRADTLALAKKGIQAKYFSSLGGLLATSEISETGTRLRVFKRAFERAKKEGFSEYDALIQASFTARDLIDFGRSGSKMHMTRRLVTFLNASIQGLDKSLRVLAADGALTRVPLKDALRPLVGMQVPPGQMRAEDAAAFRLAGRAWTKVAAIATYSAAITSMFMDDPDYQQANEKTRATHWVIPWGDNLIRIPKPFELAFLANIVERSMEATLGKDDKAWGRMWRGLAEIVTPPTDVPVVSALTGAATGVDPRTGRPIVPEHLQNLPPEQQFQHWNSGFSRWLGSAVGVSPAKIDFFFNTFGAAPGSYLLNGMDAADPDRPSGSWTDFPVVRRFVSPNHRGSQDKRDFYERAGARSAEIRRALNGIKEYEEQGRSDAARAIYEDLDEQGRLFVASQMGATPTRRLNPLERARVVGQETSRLIGELNGARPKDDGAPLPPMDRRRRQSVEEAIERIAVAEMRNSMIVTRQPGFQNRKMMDRDGLWADLRDIAPEVATELERRLGSGRDRAYDYAAVIELWPQVEQRLRTEGTEAYLDDLASEAQARTQSWGEKVYDDGELPEALIYRP